jgi:hypothetical protein
MREGGTRVREESKEDQEDRRRAVGGWPAGGKKGRRKGQWDALERKC